MVLIRMMFVKAVCWSLVMITTANAAVSIMRLPPIPPILAHKEGCYIKEINDVIPFNVTVSLLGMCEARKCNRDNIQLLSCGAMKAPGPECFITQREYSRPYAQCCPQFRCDGGENLIAE